MTTVSMVAQCTVMGVRAYMCMRVKLVPMISPQPLVTLEFTEQCKPLVEKLNSTFKSQTKYK